MTMLKLITFDATGTLLMLKYPIGQIYTCIANNFGIVADVSKVEEGFKRFWTIMSKECPNFGQSSIGWSKWWRNIVIQSFIETHDVGSFTKKDLVPVADRLIDIFSCDEGWDLAADSLNSLNCLKEKNVKIGVISNFDPRLHGILKALKIDSYFDFVITSYEAKVMKPSLHIFKQAEEKSNIHLQDGESKPFLHVGDNLDFDYLAALNAGWDAALISKKREKLLTSHPTIATNKIFNNLSEFNEFLKLSL